MSDFGFQWPGDLATLQATNRNPMSQPLSRKAKRKFAKAAKKNAIFKRDPDPSTGSGSKRRIIKQSEQFSEHPDLSAYAHYVDFAQILSSLLDTFDEIEASMPGVGNGEEMKEISPDSKSEDSSSSESSDRSDNEDSDGSGFDDGPNPPNSPCSSNSGDSAGSSSEHLFDSDEAEFGDGEYSSESAELSDFPSPPMKTIQAVPSLARNKCRYAYLYTNERDSYNLLAPLDGFRVYYH
ncbi:hypothetical protein TWF694_005270 [Orbilia ellipsospora]|uniref:Uncharacterized protein n=1 Tax=Orbilia ellipsospora TaxID=2528407 RepID=A0AAV9WUT6_9PEZI